MSDKQERVHKFFDTVRSGDIIIFSVHADDAYSKLRYKVLDMVAEANETTIRIETINSYKQTYRLRRGFCLGINHIGFDVPHNLKSLLLRIRN